ncbi:MAG: right-handed parallel beta-helix repeat-containing protein [Crocinitomicaceae bacterium]|nr:right-handed parallel beta-helix repeat-containing protein [Crocinitomicaceae bacterium]
MKHQIRYTFIALILVLLSVTTLNTSCKKTTFFSKGNLAFSKDTVVFDTIFTTIGSTTKQLKIYNKENNTVLIEEVELMGGNASSFRVNLDGLQGTHFSNLELESKDSLFMFIEVTLDPNGATLPIVVEDSIRFRTNGKDQYVILAAWGQDMYYHYSDLSAPSSEWNLNEGTWSNDKPHVIYGAAFVDEGKHLIIPAGTKIYMHKNSFLYVYKGTLTIDGDLGNEVMIQGDRLESSYDDVSGQYYGVYFNQALSSTIDYAIIKNGTTGIHIEKDGANGSNPTVTVTNTIIQNHARYGIMNFAGGKVVATNCVITNNGFHAFINLAGSGFHFNHCTLGGYATGQTQLPCIGISDFYNDGNGNVLVTDINGTFINCVIYGNQEGELAFNLDNNGTNTFSVKNCAIKMNPQGTEPFYEQSTMVWNQSPAFKNPPKFDYDIWSTSSLIDKGITTIPIVDKDIKGNFRVGAPDIGAYEFQ